MKLGQYITDDDVWDLEPFKDWTQNYLFWCKKYMTFKINTLSNRFLEDEETFNKIVSSLEDIKNIETLKDEINDLSKIKVKGAKSYFNALYKFYHFLIKVEAKDIKDINNKTIKAFISYLDIEAKEKAKAENRNVELLSNATKENFIVRIKNFFRYIDDHNSIKNGTSTFTYGLNISTKEIFKNNKKEIEIISPDKEYSDFLSGVDEVVFKHDNTRNKLFLKIALFTGMRISEIAYLKYKDISLDGKQFSFNITGKGNKKRTLYVNKKDIYSLWTDYLKERPIKSYDDYAFANSKGQPLADRTVSNYVRKILSLKNIKTTKKGLHIVRHSLCSKLIFNGEHTLEDVKTLLGHEDIATTQIYSHITKEHIKKTAKEVSAVINKEYKALK